MISKSWKLFILHILDDNSHKFGSTRVGFWITIWTLILEVVINKHSLELIYQEKL